jgi:hypothetical protein
MSHTLDGADAVIRRHAARCPRVVYDSEEEQ